MSTNDVRYTGNLIRINYKYISRLFSLDDIEKKYVSNCLISVNDLDSFNIGDLVEFYDYGTNKGAEMFIIIGIGLKRDQKYFIIEFQGINSQKNKTIYGTTKAIKYISVEDLK